MGGSHGGGVSVAGEDPYEAFLRGQGDLKKTDRRIDDGVGGVAVKSRKERAVELRLRAKEKLASGFKNANAAVEEQRHLLQETVNLFDHSSTSKSDELVTMLEHLEFDYSVWKRGTIQNWRSDSTNVFAGKPKRLTRTDEREK